jgi:DNA-binding response OmpR family regulator
MSILLADDDAQLATFLSKSLESEGYSVHTALDESTVLAELERQNYKLIILDLNFGQTDGLDLLEKLRAGGVETPVMVLSARNRVSDRIQSLNLGADDYVTKPFSFQELAARANAILRRKSDPSLNVLRVEDLELDPGLRKVQRGNREIKLSPKEFALLQLLMRHAGETVSRQTLLQETWGTQETDSNLVDVYVNYLRKKVDSFSAEKLIQTVRGAGYRLGRPAPSGNGMTAQRGWPAALPARASGKNVADQAAAIAQPTVRALIHSVAHDLAQPLTSVRCYLEMLALHDPATPPQPAELKSMEQQTDRAIALAKGISALARDPGPNLEPWVSLEQLLTEVLNEFTVVMNSGLLTVVRRWDSSMQVTSSPALRQFLVLLVSKLVGRNTRPLTLTLTSRRKEGFCDLELRWQCTDNPQNQVADAGSVFAKDLKNVHEIAYQVGGELRLGEGQPQITLTLPIAQVAAPGRAGVLR